MNKTSSTTTIKPYFIRAVYQWCTENGYTPYLDTYINADTIVPINYSSNNRIILSLGIQAIDQLVLGNEFIKFIARFKGKIEKILIPILVVNSIYSYETGHGIEFNPETDRLLTKESEFGNDIDNLFIKKTPHLSIVK
ncbi:MAG: ClpXP protease specificity-enhancing factor [Bordetella sp.]|nr:MAG: ClpXP protease specificity-enhancing factor [Bordetella sp.]